MDPVYATYLGIWATIVTCAIGAAVGIALGVKHHARWLPFGLICPLLGSAGVHLSDSDHKPLLHGALWAMSVIAGYVGWSSRPRLLTRDPRAVAADELGLDAVHTDPMKSSALVKDRIRRARSIVIVAPTGYASVKAFQDDLVTSLAGPGRITLFVLSPGCELFRDLCSVMADVEDIREDIERTRMLYRNIVNKARLEAEARDRDASKIVVSMRVHSGLGVAYSLIQCDGKWAWYTPQFLRRAPSHSPSMEISSGSRAWELVADSLTELSKPMASTEICIDAPVPTAMVSAAKWSIITPANSRDFLLPAHLLSAEEGTIAVWVDLPPVGNGVRAAPGYRYVWGSTRIDNGVIVDGLGLHYVSENGPPRWQVAIRRRGRDGRFPWVEDEPTAGPKHLAFSWSRTSIARLYVDGIQKDPSTATVNCEMEWPVEQHTLRIGCVCSSPNNYAESPLGSFTVFDRCLSADEIAAWMKHSKPLG